MSLLKVGVAFWQALNAIHARVLARSNHFMKRLLLEREADLRLHRARTLVRSRNAETRATRLRERLNDVAARVVWKIGNHRVRGRTGKDRGRVPVRDSRLIECIEKIQSHRNRQAFLAPHEGAGDRKVGRVTKQPLR